MNLDQIFAEARQRVHAAIDLRIAIAVRATAGLGQHHRRAIGQLFKRREAAK